MVNTWKAHLFCLPFDLLIVGEARCGDGKVFGNIGQISEPGLVEVEVEVGRISRQDPAGLGPR